MKRNVPLLIAASHFWSYALNAFLFRNGPMTMTRADIVMLTGLSVSEPFSPYRMFDETKHKLKPKERGGWTGYVSRHTKKGFVGDREHTAFLNMWLEKFIFCGTSVGPTSNYSAWQSSWPAARKFRLGIICSDLHILYFTKSVKLLKWEKIGNLGGPWWFTG